MDLGFGKILDKMYCEQAQFFVKLYILEYILEILFYYFIEVILSFTNVNGVTYIKRHLVDNKNILHSLMYEYLPSTFIVEQKIQPPFQKALHDKLFKI